LSGLGIEPTFDAGLLTREKCRADEELLDLAPTLLAFDIVRLEHDPGGAELCRWRKLSLGLHGRAVVGARQFWCRDGSGAL
jgi:hypothetical protein